MHARAGARGGVGGIGSVGGVGEGCEITIIGWKILRAKRTSAPEQSLRKTAEFPMSPDPLSRLTSPSTHAPLLEKCGNRE